MNNVTVASYVLCDVNYLPLFLLIISADMNSNACQIATDHVVRE